MEESFWEIGLKKSNLCELLAITDKMLDPKGG